MVEAGSIGVTSVVSVLFKNVGDALIGALAWFAFGWAFAYGEILGESPDSPTTSTQWFIGSSGYFMQNVNPCMYVAHPHTMLLRYVEITCCFQLCSLIK